MVVHACNPSSWEAGEKKDQKFKVDLGYIASLRPAKATGFFLCLKNNEKNFLNTWLSEM
jgi:hypothetical protein